MKSVPDKHKNSLSERAYSKLRQDILKGNWEPGQKLQIAKLKEHYGIGWSPLREALNRLCTVGFVEKLDQQGFYVSKIGEEELLDLSNARILLDELAIRQCFCRRRNDWEERILIAYHRLKKCGMTENDSQSKCSDEWRDLHRNFHYELISNCGSNWILQYCQQLFDQFNRYRAIVLEKTMTEKLIDRKEDQEHFAIVNACLEGDEDKTIELLALHYKLSAEIILDKELELLKDPFRVVYK